MAQYLNSDWFTLAGLLFGFIGVIGVVLTAVFYYRSIRIPIPAYVDAWRTIIVDKATSATPGLQVLHDGVAILGTDITSATVYVWNAGRAPIRKADVLRKYAFYLGEDGTLLHANILKATRQECGISIVLTEPPSNKVDLNFDVLEYGDGAAVQLIFTGLPATPILLDGVCVGAEKIRDATIEYRGNHFNYDTWMKSTGIGFLMIGTAIIAIVTTVRERSIMGTIVFAAFGVAGLYGFVASLRIRAGSFNSSLKRLTQTNVAARRRKKKKQ